MSAQATPQPSHIGELFGYPISDFFLSHFSSGQNIWNYSLGCGSTASYGLPSPLFGTVEAQELVDRIEARLLELELRADTVQFREEYALARRILRRVFYDNCTNAYNLAFAWMNGATPEMMAYKRQAYEAFHLRGEVWPSYRYSWQYKAAQAKEALPPKRPAQSVKSLPAARKEA